MHTNKLESNPTTNGREGKTNRRRTQIYPERAEAVERYFASSVVPRTRDYGGQVRGRKVDRARNMK
jgi:hypothetical protein